MPRRRPVVFIGDADGEVARVIRGGECGITVSPDDPAGLAEVIGGLADAPERVEAMGSRARGLFDREYSREAAFTKWCGVLDGVSGNPLSAGTGRGLG